LFLSSFFLSFYTGQVGGEKWTGGRRKVDRWEEKSGQVGGEKWTGLRRRIRLDVQTFVYCSFV
jgi:hypothetical protein